MTDMYRFDLATNDSEEKSVFVNAEQITHWHHDGDGNTLLHFVGGSTVTVTNCAWEMLERIEPEPDYYEDDSDEDDHPVELLSVKHGVVDGELKPGMWVALNTVMSYADGSTTEFITEAVMDGTRDSGGVMYHYFRDGIIDDEPHGSFGWPAHQFNTQAFDIEEV